MKTDNPAGRKVHAGPFLLTPLFASELRMKTWLESGLPADVRDHATLTPEESSAFARLSSVPGHPMVTSSTSGMRPRAPTELYDHKDTPK